MHESTALDDGAADGPGGVVDRRRLDRDPEGVDVGKDVGFGALDVNYTTGSPR